MGAVRVPKEAKDPKDRKDPKVAIVRGMESTNITALRTKSAASVVLTPTSASTSTKLAKVASNPLVVRLTKNSNLQ